MFLNDSDNEVISMERIKSNSEVPIEKEPDAAPAAKPGAKPAAKLDTSNAAKGGDRRFNRQGKDTIHHSRVCMKKMSKKENKLLT